MERPVETLNHLNERYQSNLARDIREGLTASQKCIPCKYLYDARGSKLFEDICHLPEYYPSRTELSILKEIAPELMGTLAHKDLVELGSGASLKVRILLDAAGESSRATMRYIPVDISESALIEASKDIVERYPELQVLGVVTDFTCHLDALPIGRPLMFSFLGSTIGNMGKDESISFLGTLSQNMKPDDRLLVGFDMVKSRKTLEAAYNDSEGLTSEFNKNVLYVLNNELNADFDPSHFDHLAFFNEVDSRIEMHLRANRDIIVRLESIDMEVEFQNGETIHTENSRKFTKHMIEEMVGWADLSIQEQYSDPDGWFCLVLMGPKWRIPAATLWPTVIKGMARNGLAGG
jgi:L-histidine N-alpha-methyltransferase